MIARNIRLTQIDPFVTALSAGYCVIVSALIRGEPFDDKLSAKLYSMVENGELPFTHAVLAEKKERTPMIPRRHPLRFLILTGFCFLPTSGRRPRTLTPSSSPPGRYRWSTACHVPSFACCRPRIIWRQGFRTISNRPSCTPSTAVDKICPGPCWLGHWWVRR